MWASLLPHGYVIACSRVNYDVIAINRTFYQTVDVLQALSVHTNTAMTALLWNSTFLASFSAGCGLGKGTLMQGSSTSTECF